MSTPEEEVAFQDGYRRGLDVATAIVGGSREVIAAGVCVEEKSVVKELILRLLDALVERIEVMRGEKEDGE